MPFSTRPLCFLFDNGSLRPASTWNLRAIATSLEPRIGAPVQAVSLLHSSGVDASELGGVPARLLEPSLQVFLSKKPEGAAIMLPLFFGPSAALTEYVPQRMAALRAHFPKNHLVLADPLNPNPALAEPLLVTALEKRLRGFLKDAGLVKPQVVLVDHGSPQKRVAEVRDTLGRALARRCEDIVAGLHVASMERRPGPDFAFNEPLLADRLRTAPCDTGDVVVLLQFLSPGRHAGADGDIAQICTEARVERPELRTHITDTIGSLPEIVDVLAARYESALAAARAK